MRFGGTLAWLAGLAHHAWLGGVMVAALAVSGGSARAAQPYVPQPADPLLEPWRLRTYPDMSGLGAECMAEGPDGTLWFGTPEMVWSFDGFSWIEHPTTFIQGGSPRTLCAAPTGIVYAGGKWGIIAWERGSWVRLFPAQGQRSAEIRKLICARNGTLWAATDLGALSYDGDHWTLFTDPTTARTQDGLAARLGVTLVVMSESVSGRLRLAGGDGGSVDLVDIAEDVHGGLWAGTGGGQILRLVATPARDPAPAMEPRTDWELFDESDGIKRGRTPSILPLREGPVWVVFGSDSGHANVFDAGAWRAVDLRAAGVPGDVHHPLQTRDGTIWLSSRYVVSALRGGSWRNYARPEVPIPSATNYLVESRDGALWIAGPSTEIVRVDYDTGRWITLRDVIFEWESTSGAQWFLHRSGRVVRREQDAWTSYGIEDGVIDAPVALVGADDGEVWVAGSHGGEAAAAHFSRGQWTRHILDNFSWGVDWRGVFRSSDGSLWFSAAVDSSGPANHRAGILCFREGRWIHHHQPGRAIPPADDSDPSILLPATQRPQPIGKFHFVGETADGRIWAGQRLIVAWDGKAWSKQELPGGVRIENIESMLTTRERELWIGTRAFGVVRFDGRAWHAFKHKDGLVANSVRGLAQTSDGSIWAATERDISRYDGVGWTGGFFPPSMIFDHESGRLRAGRSRSLWVNHFALDWMRRSWSRAPRIDTTTCEFWTRGYDYKSVPPETTIDTSVARVSPPGNLAVLWSGRVPWRTGGEAQLQFSHRLDDDAWSPFSSETGHAFFTLPAGPHRLEVRARDRDFNVDPTPAVLEFIVQPPVWRQGWFVGLMAVLGALLLTQSVRVLMEKRRLRLAHDLLEERVRQRTTELEVANRELESFSYSVSHDLRSPLRTIDGFSQILASDYRDKLDSEAHEDLQHIRSAAQRMGALIDAMLSLARVTRGALRMVEVDLSSLAQEILAELARADPGAHVEVAVTQGVVVEGDPALMRNVLENLLGNAWKFSARRPGARIEFGAERRGGEIVCHVRDNGAGFDRALARNLFGAFQRFHDGAQFPGTGVGLATVQRIIHRHGGRVEAESAVGAGATFYFTLPVRTATGRAGQH